ncbi:alanine--glyoxylate aminotransferase family protein [soil metagenome]
MVITFYPGPSQVYAQIPGYVKDAYDQGILSINHRSPAFSEILERALNLLKDKLNIPEDYSIVFTSSATECWEIIAQSLIKFQSFHLYNGAFGEKWLEYTRKLKPGATGNAFSIHEEINPEILNLKAETEIICLTQNETSNGTQVNSKTMKWIRKNYPEQLISVDATSSMAGIVLDFSLADIWFASVQKCFGLPAGLAVMILSPAAKKRAEEIQEKEHYNSLNFILENAAKLQTPYTPNVLNIYLLMRIMEEVAKIEEIDKKLNDRFETLSEFLKNISQLKMLCNNEKVRSRTVLAIEGDPALVKKIKAEAAKKDIILGNGYGRLKDITFRIANFPAIPDSHFDQLYSFFKRYFFS